MQVSTAEAKNNLTRILRAAEAGELVVVTRHGKPVAQIGPPTAEKKRKVRLGGWEGRIKFKPGWDAPIDPDRFLEGDL